MAIQNNEESAPELFFSGWGYDSRMAEEGYERDEGFEAVAVRVGGQTFAARIISGYAVFRDVEDTDERAAWFITRYASENEDVYPELDKFWFAQQWKQGAVGRCVIYKAAYMTPFQCAHMMFRPDGTGLAVDTHENPLVDFRWDRAGEQQAEGQTGRQAEQSGNEGNSDAQTLSWVELRAADPDDLQPLCARIFDRQVNPRIANPYLAPLGISPEDFVDVPHRFECGSEEELQRLTVAIVQSHPGLFEKEDSKPVTIKYRARTGNKRAFMAVMRSYWDDPVPNLGRLQSLCDLALRLNTFVGEEWTYWMETPNRKGDFDKQMHKIFVEVSRPSAHERAESLLMLNDWLQGKVRDEKRLRLLSLKSDMGGVESEVETEV